MPDCICHVNIPSADLQESQDFYGSLFGWSFMPNTDTYLLFNDGERGIGGGFTSTRSVSEDGGPVLFIKVDNLEQKLALVGQLGGKVLSERQHVGTQDSGFGWWASFSDPHGNHMGLFTTNEKDQN